MVTVFPKVTKDPYRFTEEFNIVIQVYQPDFSDMYQLVYMLVSESSEENVSFFFTFKSHFQMEKKIKIKL